MNAQRKSEEGTQVMRQTNNLPFFGLGKNEYSILHGKISTDVQKNVVV